MGEVENVRVVVRVRPLDAGNEEGCQNVVTVDKTSKSITVFKAPNPPKVYYFDNVFDEDSSQVRASLPLSLNILSLQRGWMFDQ